MDWLTILFAISIGLIIFLIYLYLSLKAQIPVRTQEQYRKWREKEFALIQQEQKEIAHREALSQLQEQINLRAQEVYQAWRVRDVESLQNELKAVAHKEAITLAHEQFQAWCAREVQSIHETARKEASTQLERWKDEYGESIKTQAIKQSRNVIVGQVTEQLSPYLPDFMSKYNPKDARFLGKPIDFIVFKGLNDGQVEEIIFVEIKTGSSTLTASEKQVKKVVDEKNVRWDEFHIEREETAYPEPQLPSLESVSLVSEAQMPLPVATVAEDFASPIREYSMIENYQEGEMISHHTFGIGKVIKVDSLSHKIEVEFSREGIKVLSHINR